jgi:hypothetical protein
MRSLGPVLKAPPLSVAAMMTKKENETLKFATRINTTPNGRGAGRWALARWRVGVAGA